MTVVEFKNVSVIFGQKPKNALDLAYQGKSKEEISQKTDNVLGVFNCSMAIEKGEICVLMGLSGSGKSTLLRTINGLNKITHGNVIVTCEGETINVAKCDQKTLQKLRTNWVAMVFQQFGLLPWRTVEENVGLGLELRGTPKEKQKKIVEEKLKLVDLAQWKDKFAHELSGGMQQRVGLARALATDAEILLMDEPFSALDPLIRNHLQDELLQLQKKLKKTIIFVSHDLDEAIKIGTHIAIMDGGKIVQYGKPEDIVLKPENQYVADFVSHMNPLHVLRCVSLMTHTEKIKTQQNEIILDETGHKRIELNQNGEMVNAKIKDINAQIMRYTPETNIKNITKNTIVIVSPQLPMYGAIQILHQINTPIMIEENQKIIGIVGHNEIYRGMMRPAEKENNANEEKM